MRAALLCLVLFGPSSPAVGQEDRSFRDLLDSQATAPHKLKELDGTWTEVAITLKRRGGTASGGFINQIGKAYGSLQRPINYYTKGKTILLDVRPFLIAYR